MKKIILSVFAVWSLEGSAKLPPHLQGMTCEKEILSVLAKQGAADSWVRTVDPGANVMAFRTPTKSVGRWVEIQSFPNPYLMILEPTKSKVYEWDAKTCATLKLGDVAGVPFKKAKPSDFTDAKLAGLMEDDKKALIYIWSPTMTYSVTEMHTFEKVAKDMNLEFIPVLDYRVTEKRAKEVVEGRSPAVKLNRFSSIELYMRQGALHFPSSFVVSHGKISGLIFGAKPEQELKEVIAKEMMQNSGVTH
ncbi:MAG TPA: hypothetical protein VNJ01_02190 [Bacteriovoracaceae bacterium]|nr:hypothetical protein [Bacteriovoracaceae bacterium]